MTMYKFSKNSLNALKGVNPKLVSIFLEAIATTPIDFGIPASGGLRTTEEQRLLFDNGKTKLDGVKHKSKHQTGLAVDVYAFVNGKASWDERHLSLIAGVVTTIAASRGINLKWGGTFGSNNFTGWDMPHFEITL